MNELLGFRPEWPAPRTVSAFISYRGGGNSLPPFDSNNLGSHVGDEMTAVRRNRERLYDYLGIPEPCWLEQVHGTKVVEAGRETYLSEADGSTTRERGQVCVVLSADCLPVLLCDKAGSQVAAVHCGWRGLAAGILAQALARFAAPAGDIMAYLGPAIGPESYEVGQEVYEALWESAPSASIGRPVVNKPGHYLVDLYAVARMQLQTQGVASIYGGQRCTFKEADYFFSYRRDGRTGRMASLIWLN